MTEMTTKSFVWAKMKGFSAWPAKMCAVVPDHIPKPSKIDGRRCVYFFGTHNYAWIKLENMKDYLEFKDDFVNKNKTSKFQTAIEEIEENIDLERRQNEPIRITLKDMLIAEIIVTIDDENNPLQDLYMQRCRIMDRFNVGNGYNYLSVLMRVLSSEQQTEMYKQIRQKFTKNEKEYISNATHENLFWTILLPEWALTICMSKFSLSKQEIIEKIAKEDEDSLNKSDDFSF